MKKISSLLFYFICSFISNAQPSGNNSALGRLPNIMSPEVSSLGKYGSYNVNLFTGTPNINLPIYTVKETGIEIPISVGYDASGFIPNKNAGVTGQNWNLTAGGAITRIVNWEPDEKYNTAPTGGEQYFGTDRGYIYGMLKANLGTYDTAFIRTLQHVNYNVPYNNPPSDSLKYEYAPDVFTFNFLGHSGKFFLGNDGQVKVVSERRYKIDLSEFKGQYNLVDTINLYTTNITTLDTSIISRIKITSDDGYQFFFGGSVSSLELSFSFSGLTARDVVPTSGRINSWHITKIITPEGDQIIFKYQKYTDDNRRVLSNLANSFNGNWSTRNGDFLDVKFGWNDRITSDQCAVSQTSNTTQTPGKSLIKVVYLTEIDTKTEKIKFSYTDKAYDTTLNNDSVPFYGNSILTNMASYLGPISNYRTKKLAHISIYDSLNTGDIDLFPSSRVVNFSYSFSGSSSTGYRMFLNQIDFGSNEKYSFDYYSGTLPDPMTKGVDIWGYYNGKNSNTELFGDPGATYGTSGEYETDFSGSGHNRLADSNYNNIALLQKITYPTGGTTEFTYENHTYGKVLKRQVSSGSIVPNWINSNGVAGGVRIKQIKNIPGSTVTYKYTLNYEHNKNDSSSGLLINPGVYLLNLATTPEGYWHVELADNNLSAAASYSESPIIYREVVEIKDGGYTKSTFSTNLDNPDQYHLGTNSSLFSNDNSTTNFNNQLKRLYKFSSKEDERGKLLKTQIFNSTDTLLKSVEYLYNTDSTRDANRTIGFSVVYVYQFPSTFVYHNGNYYSYQWYGLYQSYALYYYHNLVSSITEKDYSLNSTSPLVKTTTFAYKSNTNPLLDTKQTTSSDGSVMKWRYTYPEDSTSNSLYQAMVNKFIVSPVLEERVYKNDTLLTVNKNNYSYFNNSNIIELSSQSTINQKKLANTDLNLMAFTKYFSNGNIAEARKNQDYYTSFLWNYNKSYPVAQVINADSASIAYTSFETNDFGNWVLYGTGTPQTDLTAPTGLNVFNLQYNNIDRYNLDSTKTYVVSLWTKNSNPILSGTNNNYPYLEINISSWVTKRTIGSWNLIECTATGVNTLDLYSTSGSLLIDELRLYPQGAQMTTYTYGALVGVTTKCDPNNRITYFEYDNSGKLKLIRDQDKNILKRFDYKYNTTQNQ